LIEEPSSYTFITYAFDNLTAEKPLLKVLVDAHCRIWKLEMDDDAEVALKAKLSHDVLLKVMEAYAGGAKNKRMHSCDYHEHENDAEKAKCMEGE
jgi:hypothetical protein